MSVEFIHWYWIYFANNWGIYSDIGYILQQLADIFWYWIYSANNWGNGDICQMEGVGLQNMLF